MLYIILIVLIDLTVHRGKVVTNKRHPCIYILQVLDEDNCPDFSYENIDTYEAEAMVHLKLVNPGVHIMAQ